ncbi:MAG: hypothetical protein H7175_14190, partial [Burkholderiales bacterium]|nr:hypothetical protein [Anaerolineae bacterium]
MSKYRKFRRAGCLLLAIPCALLTGIVGLFALFISLVSPPIGAAQPQSLPADFMRGITFESWWNGEFATVGAEQTLSQIVVPT